jgi:hypothetical protein
MVKAAVVVMVRPVFLGQLAFRRSHTGAFLLLLAADPPNIPEAEPGIHLGFLVASCVAPSRPSCSLTCSNCPTLGVDMLSRPTLGSKIEVPHSTFVLVGLGASARYVSNLLYFLRLFLASSVTFLVSVVGHDRVDEALFEGHPLGLRGFLAAAATLPIVL